MENNIRAGCQYSTANAIINSVQGESNVSFRLEKSGIINSCHSGTATYNQIYEFTFKVKFPVLFIKEITDGLKCLTLLLRNPLKSNKLS